MSLASKAAKTRKHTFANPSAKYRKGAEWIAAQDEPDDLDPDSPTGYVTVHLLCELFDLEPARVGRDVFYLRLLAVAD